VGDGERADADGVAKRRKYWAEQMDEASAFLGNTLQADLNESLEPIVDLTDAIPSSLEVAFSYDRAAAGEGPTFYMRSSLVPDLVRVITALRAMSIGLRIEYAYRSPRLQASLCSSDEVLGRVIDRVRWEAGTPSPPFELVYQRLIVLCANIYKFATHIAAAAVDITPMDLESGTEIDRGGPFLELSEKTPMASPFVSPIARRNRALVKGVFADHGFRAYPFEFWHFCAGDVYEAVLTGNRDAARFGPVTVDSGSGRVTAISDPLSEITPRETMIDRIGKALSRSSPEYEST
jgi:zinc D-Ala-D-Ala dipeptidase